MAHASRQHLFAACGALAVVLTLFIGLMTYGGAQTAPPAAATKSASTATAAAKTATATANSQAFPVDLHQGSCQRPVAQPAYKLGNAIRPLENNTAVPIQGVETSPPLLRATANPNLNLANLLKSGQAYVIIVHQSAQQYSTYLACGEVAGPFTNNQLVVGLRPINNANYAGFTTLMANGDTTTATTYVMTDLTALTGGKLTGTATPQPTPPGAQSAFTPTVAPTAQPTATPLPPSPTPSPAATATATPATVVAVTKTTTTSVQVTATPKPTP